MSIQLCERLSANARNIVSLNNLSSPDIYLIAFPFAGAGANYYRAWNDCLLSGSESSLNISLHAIRLPGRETRMEEPGIECLITLVDQIVAELTSHFWGKKIAFFGHSMGAIIAFEVSRRLGQLYGWEPEILFVSGHKAPQDDYSDNFHKQPDQVLIEEVRRLNGASALILEDTEFCNTFLPTLRSDYALIEKYRYQETGGRLACPVVACTGKDDTEVSLLEMEHWQAMSDGEFHLRVLDGEHFYLNNQLNTLVRYIKKCLHDIVLK